MEDEVGVNSWLFIEGWIWCYVRSCWSNSVRNHVKNRSLDLYQVCGFFASFCPKCWKCAFGCLRKQAEKCRKGNNSLLKMRCFNEK